MLRKLSVVFTLLAISSQTHARGIDIKLADEMAELTYLTESSTFGYGGSDIDLGVFFNEADDVQINGQMMITGNPAGNNKAFQFGIGGKLMFASLELADEEVAALAIAGQLRYVIPSSTPVAFLAGIYFAPGITSFSSADQYTEYNFSVELEVTPSARAYIGYRYMEFEFENNAEYELDDGAHFGIKFDF